MSAIETYLAAWNANTGEERTNLLQSCIATNMIYIDPHAPEPIQGIDSMQALMEKFRSRFDHQLIAEEEADTHHNVFRLRWKLQRDSGEILSRGLMVGELSEIGTIQRIIQFVDATQ